MMDEAHFHTSLRRSFLTARFPSKKWLSVNAKKALIIDGHQSAVQIGKLAAGTKRLARICRRRPLQIDAAQKSVAHVVFRAHVPSSAPRTTPPTTHTHTRAYKNQYPSE